MIANFKRNWYFPISAMALFCISASLSLGYLLGMVLAFGAALWMATQVSSLWTFTWNQPAALKGIALLTALGTCWAGQLSFYRAWSISSKTQAIQTMLPIQMDLAETVSILGAVAAVFFVYFWVLVFWKEMTRLLSENRFFADVSWAEWLVYGILAAASVVLMGIVFFQTDAFYGTAYEYDVIYTSDSPELVKNNAYLVLTHLQNDLRQPLFALFSAPFVGLPYLLGKLTGSAAFQAVCMNSVQILLLYTANFLVAKMMHLPSGKRICFMLLATCTYTYLLFGLMMEQYIVAYFWLTLCLYQILEGKQPDRFTLWGAGGSLLTSMILLPLVSAYHPIKQFKHWFWDMVKTGLEFVALMLIFCRFDVIFNLGSSLSSLGTFAGHKLTLAEKFYQYTHFLCSCFTAPSAGVNTTAVDYISWQLHPVSGIHWIGVGILVLALVSSLVNRKCKFSLVAAGWVGFSLVMLVGLGWGTQENGLILYALYFGWAFLALLFRLMDNIAQKGKMPWLIPVCSIAGGAALAAVNIPALLELLQFAVTHYPA